MFLRFMFCFIYCPSLQFHPIPFSSLVYVLVCINWHFSSVHVTAWHVLPSLARHCVVLPLFCMYMFHICRCMYWCAFLVVFPFVASHVCYCHAFPFHLFHFILFPLFPFCVSFIFMVSLCCLHPFLVI